MTLFDLIALLVIAVSALFGFQRGAVRELVGLFAFAVSALTTLVMLPFTTKLFGSLLHAHWMAVAAGVIAGFAVVYLSLKILGHWVATQLHQQSILGGADRALGLGIGAVRALILLGLFALVFDRATPAFLKPDWITGAFLYPLSSASGRMIAKVAPTSLRAFGHPSTLLNGEESPDTTPDASADTSAGPTQDTTTTDQKQTAPAPAATPPRPTPRKGKGYDRRSRDQLDSLVERTR